MERRQHRQPQVAAAAREPLEDAAQPRLVIGVLGAMDRGEREGPGLHAEALEHPRVARAITLPQHFVDHGVAGDVDAGVGDAFAAQQVARMRGGGEQEFREMVGEDAIDLLGHRAVVGAQPGFDVPHDDAQLLRRERGGEHRVGVALDQDHVRVLARQHRLHPAHDRGDLIGLRAGADLEVEVGRREIQLAEEHSVHLERIVLAGVEQPIVDAARDAGAHDRRHLDDLGAGADLDRDLHGAAPALAPSASASLRRRRPAL